MSTETTSKKKPRESVAKPADISMLNFPILDQRLVRYGGFVSHPSKAIQQKGMSYFEEIEQDTHLKACLETRAEQAIIPGWTVKPASNSEEDRFIADFVTWTLQNIRNGFYGDLKCLCDAQGKGFSVLEPIYQPINRGKYDGYIQLLDLKHIPAKYIGFDFDETGKLKPDGLVYTNGFALSTDKNKKYRFSPNRFVYARFGNSDNPYGHGCDIDCAFEVWLKTMNTKFWAVFQEVFASPTKMMLLPKGAKAEHITEAQKIMNQLQQQSGVTIPFGFELKLLEAVRSGDVQYLNFNDYCNKSISKRVLGSTLTTEGAGKGQAGGYALGQQHGTTSAFKAYADSLWLEGIVNEQVIPKIVNFNFETSTLPRFVLLDEDISRMIGFAQAVAPLVASGVEIPKGWTNDKLGIPLPADGEPILEPTSANQPATAGIDNKVFRLNSAPAKFSASVDLQQQRLTLLDSLESSAFLELQPLMEELILEAQDQIKKLPEGTVIGQVPDLKLNLGPVKKVLFEFALLHYLHGKEFAAKQLTAKGITVSPKTETVSFSWLLNRQLQSLKSFPTSLQNFSATPGDLLAQLAKLIPFTAEEIKNLISLYTDRFFTVAGLLKTEIDTVWKNQILALREGWSLRDFQKSLRDELIDLPAHRIELIYRQWMNKSFAEGKDNLANDPDIEGFVWGFRYNAILDSRVRPTHAALDGVTLPKADPFWKDHTPPWDYNCRCDREFVTQTDIDSGEYQIVQPTK